MRTHIALVIPLFGCAQVQFGPDGSGTSVGNPNKARITLLMAEIDGFDHDSAVYPVEAIDLVACDDDVVDAWWRLDRDLDLLGGELSPVPIFRSCEQTFRPAGNFVVSGTYEETSYRVEFEQPEVRLEGEWNPEAGKDYIIEFGGLDWLAFFRDPLVRGEEIDYGPHMRLHDLHRSVFEDAAALFEDIDRDGVLSDEERLIGAVCQGQDRWGC